VETGLWGVNETTFELLADLLTLHERQLGAAPHHAVARSMQSSVKSYADECRSNRGETETDSRDG
jgi:hypothetical protein